MNATVLAMDPAGVEVGTSTSRRWSPTDPQGMDCSKVWIAVPSLIPSIAIAYEGDASIRDTATFTRADAGLPGQSTRSANRVVMTNDLEVR